MTTIIPAAATLEGKKGLVLGIANGRVITDGKLVYTAEDMKVGLMNPSDLD